MLLKLPSWCIDCNYTTVYIQPQVVVNQPLISHTRAINLVAKTAQFFIRIASWTDPLGSSSGVMYGHESIANFASFFFLSGLLIFLFFDLVSGSSLFSRPIILDLKKSEVGSTKIELASWTHRGKSQFESFQFRPKGKYQIHFLTKENKYLADFFDKLVNKLLSYLTKSYVWPQCAVLFTSSSLNMVH